MAPTKTWAAIELDQSLTKLPLLPGEGSAEKGQADSSVQSLVGIDLWLLDLKKAHRHLPHYQKLLDAEELRRSERYTAEHARSTFILTRGRLRELLARYLDQDPQQLILTTNEHGKPRLADTEENEGRVFSIAHSGDYALLAFGRDIALGVDIEQIRERKSLDSLAKHCLTPPEWERWKYLPAEQKNDDFIRYWVCKEAFVKATGRGLGLGVNQVGVSADFRGFDFIPEVYGLNRAWQLSACKLGKHWYSLVRANSICHLYDLTRNNFTNRA